MSIARPLIALVVCSSAAHAAAFQPLIDRPLTLPRGAFDLTLHGTYTNWGNGALAAGSGTLKGGTLAAGVDFGTTDTAQLGIAAAFPIEPGAGFGSIVLSGAFAASRTAALRIDAGFESVGLNGNTSGLIGTSHTSRFFGGLGARVQSPLSPTVAFVFGRRTGAVHFGHFNNIGDRGLGFYLGASTLTEQSSDFLVVSGGDNNSSTVIGLNLPFGLLVQPDPHFALTLLAGYSAAIATNSGNTASLHFVPVGLEAVVSPAAPLDVGLRFVLDGYVAETGGGGGGGPGYFDLRALMLWITLRG